MSRLSKKERRRLKQKQKRKQAIRLRNESPYRRIEKGGRIESCVINDDWLERGQAMVYVLASVGGRPPAMGAFMVDLWCAGLKDAWGRLEFSHADFRDLVEKAGSGTGMDFVQGDPETVRGLIAGAIRLAHDNGFRLPPRYERWTVLLGGVGEWRQADLSNFGVDGKLRWVGPVSDLRKRLVGCTVEEFFNREDVDFIVGFEEPPDEGTFLADELAEVSEADEEEEVSEEVAGLMRERLIAEVRRWCFANREVPHPRMGEAVDLIIESMYQVPPDEDDEEDSTAVCIETLDNMAGMLMMEGPQDANELQDALDQVARTVSCFDSPDEMTQALGLGEPDDEE